MKIISIHIYPIKSLGGISLQTAKVLGRGLEFDRRWMLVDEHGIFVSQRTLPVLGQFLVRLKNGLTVTSPQGDSIFISHTPTGQNVAVSIWGDRVTGVEVDPHVSAWFTKQVGIKVKLVYMPDESNRLIDVRYAFKHETVSFADGYPILITNKASLDELNTRLSSPIEMKRFRPNLVVDCTVAFEEDKWKNIALGTAKIEVVKPCARCVVVNINPVTATKETEVLQVLSTYRKVGNKVLFGVNGLVHQNGLIHVGDRLYVND